MSGFLPSIGIVGGGSDRRPMCDNDPLTIFIRGRDLESTGILRLTREAGKYAHSMTTHKVEYAGLDRMQHNQRLDAIRQGVSESTLIHVYASQPSSRSEPHRISACLFPKYGSSNASTTVGAGGAGGGTGPFGRGAGMKRSRRGPSITAASMITFSTTSTEVKTIIPARRSTSDIRTTWLLAEIDRVGGAAARGGGGGDYNNQQTPPETDADRIMGQHFDIWSYLDPQAAFEKREINIGMRTFSILEGYRSAPLSSRDYASLTSYSVEYEKHASVRRLVEVFTTPHRLKRFIQIAQAIKVNISEEAVSDKQRERRRVSCPELHLHVADIEFPARGSLFFVCVVADASKLWNEYSASAALTSAKPAQVYTASVFTTPRGMEIHMSDRLMDARPISFSPSLFPSQSVQASCDSSRFGPRAPSPSLVCDSSRHDGWYHVR